MNTNSKYEGLTITVELNLFGLTDGLDSDEIDAVDWEASGGNFGMR